jgi:hypothetical protein
MYSSLYFVIPVSLVLMCEVLMCDICVPRRALPQIAAESKASAPLPSAFKHFVCQSALGAEHAGAARRIGGAARPRRCEANEQKCECSYCSHALIFCEAYRTKDGQSIILTTTQQTHE